MHNDKERKFLRVSLNKCISGKVGMVYLYTILGLWEILEFLKCSQSGENQRIQTIVV